MARPTDPAKLAAYLARQAANSRAYRARKAAEASGRVVEPQYSRKAPARYRPPSGGNAVERAHKVAAESRMRRAAIVGELPSARNPSVNIYVPREAPRGPATTPKKPSEQRRRVEALRQNAQAQKLQAVGRARKQTIQAELTTGSRADNLNANLNRSQKARFKAATSKITGISQQALAILFQYEGGQGDYQSAIDQISYPNELDIEDSLGRLEALAETAGRAEQLYGPRMIGRLRV